MMRAAHFVNKGSGRHRLAAGGPPLALLCCLAQQRHELLVVVPGVPEEGARKGQGSWAQEAPPIHWMWRPCRLDNYTGTGQTRTASH